MQNTELQQNLTNVKSITIPSGASYYATEGSIDTKSQYKPLATFEVVEYFQKRGFYITKYVESGVRAKKNIGKTKHRVVMRHQQNLFRKDEPELLITNSHNKYSSLWLNIGIYRFVCGNGQIMGDTFFSERVRHAGDTERYLDNLYDVVMQKFQEVINTVERMKSIELTENQKIAFVTRALDVRFKTSKRNVEMLAHQYQRNVLPQRFGDGFNDLYTVMNVIQERMIRGGFEYSTYDKKFNLVSKTTKEVKSLKLIDDINKGLMNLAVDTMNTVERISA